MSDIAIVANKEVKLGSNNTLTNAVFATPDKILIGSNNSIRGTQMSAGDQLKLGSDIKALANVYGEAYGKIDYGSSEEMGACPGGLESHFAKIVITDGDGNLTLVQ